MENKKQLIISSSLIAGILLGGCGSSSVENKIKEAKAKLYATLEENDITKENIEVVLSKIDKDGLKSEIKKMKTEDGTYSFKDIAKAVENEFYYVVEANINGTTLSAPVSNADTTISVDISPSTTLATNLIQDVSKSESNNTKIPSGAIINGSKEMVSKDIKSYLSSIGSVNIDSTNLTDLANGLTTLGSDTSLAYKTIALEKEYNTLQDATQKAQYLTKTLENVCAMSKNHENMVSSTLAKKIVDSGMFDTKYTISDIQTRLGNTNFKADFKSYIDSLDNKSTDLSEKEKAMMLVQRDLKANNISDSTKLSLDQIITFLYSNSNELCSIDTSSLMDKLHALDSSFSKVPTVIKADIWNNSNGSCGAKGHLASRVKIFGSNNIASVKITTNHDGDFEDGTPKEVSLLKVGQDWEYKTMDGAGSHECITLNTNISYTVTATSVGGDTTSVSIDRTHYAVPEARTYYKNLRASMHTTPTEMAHENIDSPTPISASRPMFSWDNPSTILSGMSGVPSDYKVKYTYEFSHVDKTSSPISPLGQCESSNASYSIDKLYSVSGFLLAKECNPTECASKIGKSASDIVCRINVQTYLLDGSDNVVSQAAGRFSYFTK